jgi:ATP-dependent DNA helicase RecQ
VAADFSSMARQVLGITLRPSQHRAASAVASGRDTLAVLPTGSGKSAIYQLAGLALGGLTVVISPLVALQRDQLRALSQRRGPDGHPIRVAELNSSQRKGAHDSTLLALERGSLDFVLLGPEQLRNPGTHDALVRSGRAVGLVTVDEAHLVSEWGHDFRPDYLRLPDAITALGRPPVLALTATAAPPVQADITRHLAMRSPALVVADFDRPNISLHVRRARPDLPVAEAIAARTAEVIQRSPTPALVYTMSHAQSEAIAERLRAVPLRAAAYHAGEPARRRTMVQDDFFAGRLDVVVATSAFGLGVDKPDVRTVVHAGVPASPDEYYQEIGRAGRDAQPASAVLVYDPRSLRLPRLFAANARVPTAVLQAVLAQLAAAVALVTLRELAHAAGVSERSAQRVVDALDELGLVELTGAGIGPIRTRSAGELLTEVESGQRRRQLLLASRIDSIRHYAETVQCRRAELLAYFGEVIQPPCRNCDNDSASSPPVRAASVDTATAVPGNPGGGAASDGAVGAAVTHCLWGPGTLLARDDHELVVAFESVGYRHLTPTALTNGLLRFIP